MSSSSRSDGDCSFDVEELLEIGTRCTELRKEKEMLKESQSQNFELIKMLELHVKSLSEACHQDKEHIQNLERELMNCSQEIDYLQDQLCERNSEFNFLKEYVDSLEVRLLEMESLQLKVHEYKEELQRSNYERVLLIEELRNKELELQNSNLCIEKLEESVLFMTLESQCETESMKVDMMALEQACFEAKKIQEVDIQEKERMSFIIRDLEVQIEDAQETIKQLERESTALRDEVVTFEKNCGELFREIENLLLSEDLLQLNVQSLLSNLENKFTVSEETRKIIHSLISRAAILLGSDAESKEKMTKMSCQIHEYECVVKQLKQELREERMKAKDEAEDLAQEMAELRYEMMHLLEEECKRRACIEQASLKKIAELEAQIKNETEQSLLVVKGLHEVQQSTA